MTFRKRTLRKMMPTTRKVAKLIGELDSISRRLKILIPEIQEIELDSKALENAKSINNEPKTDKTEGEIEW